MCRPDDFPPYDTTARIERLSTEICDILRMIGALLSLEELHIQHCDMNDPAHAEIHDEMSRRHASRTEDSSTSEAAEVEA